MTTKNKDSVEIKWLSHNRKAKCEPNPAYPNGMELNVDPNAKHSCRVDLPYPASECGVWQISCLDCNLQVMVTAAGRTDDPKSVKLPCKMLI